MARDPARRRDDFMTTVTILQVQTDLLQRQLSRRDGLSEADRQWLERALATLLRTTRELAILIGDDEEAARTAGDQVLAWPRLLALPPVHNRN